MPFPLAHPAAVLPFRRHYPRLLNLPALIVGCLIPDAGYLGKSFQLDEVTHRLSGLFAICLPAGVVIVLVFYAVRSVSLPLVPEPFRRILEPLFRQPAASLQAIVLSVLVGAGTHLAWDSFTHEDGALTRRLAILQEPIMQIRNHPVRVCHFFWYGSTFAGVALLGNAYQQWRSVVRRSAMPVAFRVRWTNAVILGCLVVPVAMIHHLVHGLWGAAMVSGFSTFLILGFVWMVERHFADHPRAPGLRRSTRA